MRISSRTPEGFPGHCLLCGKEVYLEFSDPGEDATCPHCGNLIMESAESLKALKLFAAWPEIFERLRPFLERKLKTPWDNIDPSIELPDLKLDSLETVELVMLLEEEFDFSFPDEVAEKILTLGDAIGYVLSLRGIE